MLIIDRNKIPSTSRRCFNQIEAAWLAGKLVVNNVSFYCEPEPDDVYLFTVNDEAGHVIDRIMHEGGLFQPSPTTSQYVQAQRAFKQNPTPAMSTVIKRLGAAVSREKKA